MYTHKYLEKLDCEIDDLIKKEAMNKSMELEYPIEKELHILFENRRHLIEYMRESGKYSHMAHDGKYEHMSMSGEHAVSQTEMHEKSYFGG